MPWKQALAGGSHSAGWSGSSDANQTVGSQVKVRLGRRFRTPRYKPRRQLSSYLIHRGPTYFMPAYAAGRETLQYYLRNPSLYGGEFVDTREGGINLSGSQSSNAGQNVINPVEVDL